jgi:hypothetical protein
MSDILDGTNLDFSVLSFSDPKPHEKARVVNVNNINTRQSIELTTPMMLTWGAQESLDDNKNPTGKFTMSLQFPTKDYTDPAQEAFLANLRAFEERVKDAAVANSVKWFGKPIASKDIVSMLMNTMLRHPKVANSQVADESRPPTLTVKLPCWKGSWRSEIFDEDGEPLFVPGKVNQHRSPVEFIGKQSQIACILQCGGVWLVNGKFSIVWNLKQAVVQKPKAKVEGKCLITLNNSEKAKMKAQVIEAEPMDDGTSSAMIEEDDIVVPASPAEVFKAVAAAAPAPVAAAPVASMDTSADAPATAAAPKVVKKVVKKKTDA